MAAPLDFGTALGPARTVELPGGPIDVHERGEGRPVVLLHGVALHAGFWRKVVPELADAFRCVTPTLPMGGHRLPMRADADLSPPGLADLTADLLAALDLEDAVIVGNDTGGALAQILVTRRPERVGALVLTPCDAFNHFFPWQFKGLQVAARIPGAPWIAAQALRVGLVRRSPLGFGLLTKHGIDDDVLASYVEPVRRSADVRRDLARVLRGVSSRHTTEAAERLAGFDRPTLIAWAREDRVFPTGDARRLTEIIPNARLEWIDDSWTYVPEDQPARLARLIRDFAEARPS
jgi:pimeloyl-ACP methyl ester carboxylesterase